MSILTYKFRIKDKTSRKRLNHYAIQANQVWNFCVATQREAERRRKMGTNARWPTAFDLINLCAGASYELGIPAETIATICRRFAASRNQIRKSPRFRASFGAKRALGWIPFQARTVRVVGNSITYYGKHFRFWKHREIAGTCKEGAFVQDARGLWYVTFQCEVADDLVPGEGAVGIDLGLKELATMSDGTTIPALQHYRRYEDALARAQRAGNKKRVRAIHAKIASSRRHHLHVASSKLARENRLIAVGDVSPSSLAKTKMAKSIHDASWTMLRHMLRYKTARRQAVYVDVDERWTSQTCSECGCIGGPKGIAGLAVRAWDCPECGASHDRDVNSARLILRLGRNVALRKTEIRQPLAA